MTQQAEQQDTYSTRLKRTRLLLEAITHGLELHEEDQQHSPSSPEHARDLTQVNKALIRLANLLGVEPLE